MKPCPFCGAQPTVDVEGCVHCANSECFGPRTTAVGEDAVVQWEQRATTASAIAPLITRVLKKYGISIHKIEPNGRNLGKSPIACLVDGLTEELNGEA